MRTLTLKLTAAITGRRIKPPIPDSELAALKEQARQLLQESTASDAADLADLAPAAVTLAQCPPSVGLRGRFKSEPVPQPENDEPVTWWDMAWARLTPSERAWSSQP